MKLKRIMLAAPKSGSGKTTVTCALLSALKEMGQKPIAYKCGPDYIDPMFHQRVIGIPSKNLDTFFTGEEETRQLFLKHRKEDEIAVIEGVMGLYDGLRGIREEGSSYHLAKLTRTPVILVIDAKGMGRSVTALIKGFLSEDAAQLIRGVILNRMSKSYYDIIKPLIEEECKIQVLGHIPENRELHIESRHLGLVLPGELRDIRKQVTYAAEELKETVSLEGIMMLAATAEELELPERTDSEKALPVMEEELKPVIAVAKDEAFCFYYEDNLELLQEYGVKLEYFSPLRDTELPGKCSGILLGGGYPELYAETLGRNKEMLVQIKQAVENGMPVVAECGGFLYLHTALQSKEKESFPMADVVEGVCYDTGKLVRFGYIEIEEKKSSFLGEGERIRGHEFHYFDSENNGSDCIAHKPFAERDYPCIISGESCFLGFPHLYYPSNPSFAKNFAAKARRYGERRDRD